MALPAVKHLDPVVGVDVHSVLVTPGTPPVFLPHPHVGFMLDKREYIQAAKAVVGCIAMMIVQEKVTEYIEDHPEDVTKLEHLADEATQQVNELMGGGKLPDFKNDPTVAEGTRLAKEANKLKNRISDDLGSNVGSGGSSGRPIFVNGMMRATAGTHAYHVPGLHFPLGESFAPPDKVEPSNDGESFMGSKTVLANNDPMSYMALEALSCWSVGMEPPPHNSAHTDRTYPSMPSSVMLPIPAGRPVLVGGPPIMNMAAAAKGLFKAFRGSKWAKALADKLNLKSGFLRCNVLKAEPVDVTTGEVVVQQNDFTVSGRLPLVWDRYYASHNRHAGAVGFGWQTPADIRLELMRNQDGIGAAVFFPDHATAFNAVPLDDGWTSRTYDWQHGHALYDDDGRMVLRTREGIEYGFVLPPRWREAASALDADSRLTLLLDRMADLNGNAWKFERDAYGGLARLVEWKRNRRTERVVECGTGRGLNAGLLTSLTLIDARENAHPLVSYEHDRERNLAAAIDAMAYPHHFEYAVGHRMVRHTSARGVSFYYSYQQGDDGVWRVDRAWGDNGLFDYRFAYDRARMETRATDSLGHTTITQMNERGMPVAETDPLGGVTAYRYDSHSRTSAQVDAAGRTTSWDYDRYGNVVARTLPDGSVIRTEYDVHQHPVCVTLPGGRQWRYEWDARGNLLAQTEPSGTTSRYAYDAYGQPVEHLGPRGALTRFDHDRDGYPAARTDALGYRTQFGHDATGNLVEVVDPLGQHSHYEYDRNGNLTRAIEPGGRELHFVYDADGNLVRYRDPASQVTQMEYSALGQLSRRLAPDGSTVEYWYDTEEQLVGVVNERRELYQLKRNALGRIVEEVDYWGQARRYEYGAAGELLRSIDPLGQTIDYETDALGRIVQKRVPDPRQPDGVRTETFSYDRSGNLIVAANPDSRVELEYDAAGRVVEERQGDHFVIANTYDSAGNRIERQTRLQAGGEFINAHTVRYDYDALDAVRSIQVDEAAPITFERNALGQICVEHLGAELRHELSYTSDGLLATQALFSGTGALFTSEYAYDANGEMLEKRDSRLGIERYQYDPMGRLIGHSDPVGKLHRFLYDPVGDQLKTSIRKARQPNVFGEDTKADTWIREGEHDGCYCAFDRIGNLVRRQDRQQDLMLRWDGDGLLIESLTVRQAESVGDTSGTLSICTRYAYDVFHRRTKKTTRIQHDPGIRTGAASDRTALSQTSYFFWEGDALVGELTQGDQEAGRLLSDAFSVANTVPEDALVRVDGLNDVRPGAGGQCGEAWEWVHYPDSFRPLARVSSASRSNDISFFETGVNGAPVRTIDVTGIVVWEAAYSAWGLANQRGTRTHDQPFRLQGQYFDQESGLHYNRYRYYDPHAGRFASCDPIRLAGGTGLYNYAKSSITWIDPLGLHASGGDIIVRGSAGQIISVSGTIDPSHLRRGVGTGTNATSRAWARSLGRLTDDAGHTRGCRLGGSGGKDYVWAQDPGINRGRFRVFEGEIAKEITFSRRALDFEQTHLFGNSATRPDYVRYTYTKTRPGLIVAVTRVFQNP